ncbi:uncharacterized protein LOC105196429 isoform X2 [Solenopsis invicta]|uniref:uncharacterized protein LOC105196429 isoform X2 n=1 Tax=Solenopsis invicta TaxID=13686 RepID=UPI0005962F79|nr:uncharacterized protein LOC105196429 isoform X2 [Solenopsis invicta]
MSEQFINEYYINLEYNKSNKEKVLTEISNLSKGLNIKDVNNFSARFLLAASSIEKNLSLFKSVCEHIDTVTIILEYLTNFGVKFMFDNNFDKEYNEEETILSIVLTIFNICREPKVQLFLENAIVKNSMLYKIQYDRLKQELSNQINEVILLEDSDIYAVLNYLKIIKCSYINKIWVHISIKHKFLWLLKKYLCHRNFTIRTFKSWETFTPRMSYNMHIISIWSENIRDVIFINTHMDLYGGAMLLPYIKVFDKINKGLKFSFNHLIQPSINEVNLLHLTLEVSAPMFSLFYDGKWQAPVEGTYWKHNNYIWANATSEDVKMCFESAIKGFQIWKTWSTNDRKNLLSELMTTLKYHSKLLEDIVSRLYLPFTKFVLPDKISLLCSENDRLEVIQDRTPRGIIILKEKTEEMLFLRLIQILLSGNSVIVIADANSCSLAPYCDFFSICKIPPGVINLLSNENISNLELSLCTRDYAKYETKIFTSLNYEEMYINLTLPKPIVLSLK